MSSVLPLLTLRPHDGSADVPLTSEVVLIGRDASRCNVHAHGDPYLSRVHFELRRCSATSTVTVLLRGKRRSWLNGFILPNDVPVEVTRDADNEKYQPPGCESDDPILFVSVPNRDAVARAAFGKASPDTRSAGCRARHQVPRRRLRRSTWSSRRAALRAVSSAWRPPMARFSTTWYLPATDREWRSAWPYLRG